MNGIVRSVLSVLLHWFKQVISALWNFFCGGKDGSFLAFVTQNWKAMVIVLLLLGFFIDCAVYLFRWRPDWVWKSRWRKLFSKRNNTQVSKVAENISVQQNKASPVLQENPVEMDSPALQESQTRKYFPTVDGTKKWSMGENSKPQLTFDPVFDEDIPEWNGAALRPNQSTESASSRVTPERLMDIQSGFARPIPAESIYTGGSLHPGLEKSTLQQHLGAVEMEDVSADVPQPEFHPLTEVKPAPVSNEKKARGISRIAHQARSLMGIADEDSRPTVADLHQTVDVSQAFHAPIYPNQLNQKG